VQDDTDMTAEEFEKRAEFALPAPDEAQWRQDVLARLDRIIDLLTVPATQVFQYHYEPPAAQNGYQCQICKQWVRYGQTHYCTGYVGGAAS